MATIAMILRKPPYGDINAAEAVRHALGAASGDLSVDLILFDGGVLLAKKGQDDAGSGFTNLEGALKDCLDMGVRVYADGPSLEACGVPAEGLVDGVKIADGPTIAGIIRDARSTMIF